jgi:PTS system mannose-specific IIC component
MNIQAWQVILITLIAFIKAIDFYGTQILTFNSIIYGLLTGLVLGDPMTGLAVGGTIQLMSLGVAGLGGASVPDYQTAAIIATAISIASGKGTQVGLAVGVAVGMLGVQLDVIAKILNGFIARKSQAYANQHEFKKMLAILWICPVLIGLTAALPTFLSITWGVSAVNFVLNVMPAWFTSGLSIAGGLLPVIGVGMLLNYMPAKKYLSFIILGFVLAAYLKMSILPIALIGAACAYEMYKQKTNEQKKLAVAAQEGALEDE